MPVCGVSRRDVDDDRREAVRAAESDETSQRPLEEVDADLAARQRVGIGDFVELLNTACLSL